ncbi:mu-like prophage I family protein [Escherichia coli P0299917.10]|uniref:phage protease n=1 Tax=Escherichia coli TaxID=562 RepID=UPI0002CBD314|nr:phage protease [Escherichia coli]EMW38230.1 mu-like prophage I family protein [Escherichia coli 2788150]ENC42584.1 mu-like prophage I family protein [Escherichia coli P0299917.10]ENC83153.1 mu-like prophage I family protein [Escherichia coli P0299917.7]
MKMNIAALSLEITKATHSEIQLFPAGEFSAVDGRPHTDEVESGKWVLTAELAAQLVAQVAARATPFVIDYEHQTLRAVNNGKPAPAAGWFSQVEWREGVGLYATGVEWTENAAAMIAAGEYKFISPVFAYNKRGEVLELLHAALTNPPALDGMDAVMLAAASRLASLSTETETKTVNPEQLANLLAQLRWLLTLPETSTAEEVCAELQKIIDAVSGGEGTAAASVNLLDLLNQKDEQIASLSASAYDPTKHIPLTAYEELQGRYAALAQQSGEAEAGALIQAALSDGRLLPVQEDWAKDYAGRDINGFKSWLENAPKLVALSKTQTGGKAPKTPSPAPAQIKTGDDIDVDIAICSMMGVDPEDVARYAGDE